MPRPSPFVTSHAAPVDSRSEATLDTSISANCLVCRQIIMFSLPCFLTRKLTILCWSPTLKRVSGPKCVLVYLKHQHTHTHTHTHTCANQTHTNTTTHTGKTCTHFCVPLEHTSSDALPPTNTMQQTHGPAPVHRPPPHFSKHSAHTPRCQLQSKPHHPRSGCGFSSTQCSIEQKSASHCARREVRRIK